MMELNVAILNTYVHIFMYFYYFLSSFQSLRGFTNKLKPVMTTIQIAQLILILGQCIAAKFCGNSNLFYAFSINLAILIFFFSKFYVDNYLKRRKEREN